MPPGSILSTTRITRHPKVVSRNLDEGEGGVLLHLESGNYHGLSAVGWMIWSLIDGERTFGDMIAELRAQFEDVPPDLADELERFIEVLQSRNLIEITPT